ncbi:Spy/CpxP family protein refolding chaperone [Tepidiphilus olei]|uniref:Spy/CpxP family protein refolding chaperone n=1 Tax=Tepidiphilus olei TaxID=2502184 RepID=UPI001C8F1FDF|nr:Spy/CpxP family protein refolding chaperone [Tepidiphilus olei]
MNTKQKLVGALAAMALLGTVASASAQQGQPYYGYGMGPGMMGGWCPMCGMGPGMMGMGPGMMGPGMMGMGPRGMWGDWDDWDDRYMGPGMMGPGMMGPGMMGGYGYGPALDLTEQQQAKIAQIQEDFRKKQGDLAAKMYAEQAKLNEIYYSGKRDPAAIDNQYKKICDLRRQMIQIQVDAQNRMDAVLTPEQKERLRGYYGGRGGMMR